MMTEYSFFGPAMTLKECHTLCLPRLWNHLESPAPLMNQPNPNVPHLQASDHTAALLEN